MQEIAKCENEDLIEKEIDLRKNLEEISNKISDLCANKNKMMANEWQMNGLVKPFSLIQNMVHFWIFWIFVF